MLLAQYKTFTVSALCKVVRVSRLYPILAVYIIGFSPIGLDIKVLVV